MLARWFKIILFLFTTSVLFSTQAFSTTCLRTGGSSYGTAIISLPSQLIVKEDVAPGTKIWESAKVAAGTVIITCGAGDNLRFNTGIATDLPDANYINTYKTSNPSIGFKIEEIRESTPKTPDADTDFYMLDNGMRISGEAYMTVANVPSTVTISYRVALIALGKITPGSITIPALTASYSILNYENNVLAKFTFSIGSGSVKPLYLPCEVNGSTIQVPLNDVLLTNLPSVGSVANPRNFNIDMVCKAGSKVVASLTGSKDGDTGANGVLKVTNAGGAGVSTGIGIQLLYKDTPVVINSDITLTPSAEGGAESFLFTAQYYKTKASATPGSANATATLELTYQ